MSLIKIILLLLILILLKYKSKKNDTIESILMRYNNKFRRKDISVRNVEDNLMDYISYVKSIKEGKVKNIIQSQNYDRPKISFIISVFNKENYLNSLILSTIFLSFPEKEKIIISLIF